jgi:hypothetical protein
LGRVLGLRGERQDCRAGAPRLTCTSYWPEGSSRGAPAAMNLSRRSALATRGNWNLVQPIRKAKRKARTGRPVSGQCATFQRS